MEFHPPHHCKQFFYCLTLEIKIRQIPMVKSSLLPFHRCSHTIFRSIFQPEFNICFIRLWQMIQLCKIFLKDSLYFFPLVIIPKDCLIIHINACAKLPAFIPCSISVLFYIASPSPSMTSISFLYPASLAAP